MSKKTIENQLDELLADLDRAHKTIELLTERELKQDARVAELEEHNLNQAKMLSEFGNPSVEDARITRIEFLESKLERVRDAEVICTRCGHVNKTLIIDEVRPDLAKRTSPAALHETAQEYRDRIESGGGDE